MRSPVGPPTDPRGVSTRAPRTPPSSNPPSAHPDARDASASPSSAPRASSTTERTSWLFASPPTPWRSVLVSTTSRATRLRRRTRRTTRATRRRRSRPRRSRRGNVPATLRVAPFASPRVSPSVSRAWTPTSRGDASVPKRDDRRARSLMTIRRRPSADDHPPTTIRPPSRTPRRFCAEPERRRFDSTTPRDAR